LKNMLNNALPRTFVRKVGQRLLLRICPNPITHVETCDPVSALTFDDGPHSVYTPRVLSILEKHGASATFFMVGEAAKRHPEIVKMVASRGHVIGNHSWDHPNLTQIRSRLSRLKQMRACARVTAPYCKRLFRPPFGMQDTQIRLDALLFRYKLILWSVSAQDWLPQGAEDIANKIIDRVTPGSIFLLHDSMCSNKPDIQWDREPMLEGLEIALGVLKQKIHFVTIPELLQAGRPVSNWPRQVDS
jgi:peptidoglycan-N-acetylglucosamine deacetylase